MLLLSAQIHQPLLSLLKLPMSVLSVSVGLNGISVVTPVLNWWMFWSSEKACISATEESLQTAWYEKVLCSA